VSADREAIRKNAVHLISMLEKRGFDTRILESQGSPPVVFGELLTPGAERTAVFYAHYDGQPVDPESWVSDPWIPILRSDSIEMGGVEIEWPLPGTDTSSLDPESRIYARSASDDKAPIIAILAAVDALEAAGIDPSINIKLFFEGEEEAGSTHIRDMLEKHVDLLEADVWFFCDGPVHQSRRPEINFGVRGIVGLQMTVYGPTRHLHSGHYGNWVPHPTVTLIHLLTSMRDTEGNVLVEGFYDTIRPITPVEQKAIDAIPEVEGQLMDELGLGRTEGDGARLPERIMLPAMNLSGFQAGETGSQSKNAIPSEANAYIDFRLVPDLVPQRVREVIEKHIEGEGFHIVREDPDLETRLTYERVIKLNWGRGYPSVRTSMELPVSRAVVKVAREVAGESLVEVPTHGGSLPMNVFEEVLGKPLITIPIVNHDNNQHGANENLRLKNLWDGIEMFGQVIARLGIVWDRQ
jgi:acetylornithine deacetylase/succinyl-diaminopimelate desuccinylase-like protein